MLSQLEVTPVDGVKQVFMAQHLAWVLQALPTVQGQPPAGEGSERATYTMSTIEQWMGAAQIKVQPWVAGGLNAEQAIALSRKIGADRGLYMIGGRLLERTPSGAYANYITDVVDGGKALSSSS